MFNPFLSEWDVVCQICMLETVSSHLYGLSSPHISLWEVDFCSYWTNIPSDRVCYFILWYLGVHPPFSGCWLESTPRGPHTSPPWLEWLGVVTSACMAQFQLPRLVLPLRHYGTSWSPNVLVHSHQAYLPLTQSKASGHAFYSSNTHWLVIWIPGMTNHAWHALSSHLIYFSPNSLKHGAGN
jgi:hypothetical protein